MTFIALVLIQFFKAYTYRSDRHSVLRRPRCSPHDALTCSARQPDARPNRPRVPLGKMALLLINSGGCAAASSVGTDGRCQHGHPRHALTLRPTR